MYVCRAKKAIYGALEASLLFWEKLSKSLEEMRYQRNEYDWCVMQKIIDNKQCTILWNLDDLKTSHVYPALFVVNYLFHDTPVIFISLVSHFF